MAALTAYFISRYCCPFLYKVGCILSSLEEVTARVVGRGQETYHPSGGGVCGRDNCIFLCTEENNRS